MSSDSSRPSADDDSVVNPSSPSDAEKTPEDSLETLAEKSSENSLPGEAPRRDFLNVAKTTFMCGSLLASYGTFAYYSGRFLLPSIDRSGTWQFLSTEEELKAAGSMQYTAPSGAKVVVASHDDPEHPFLALSSVCPHLGCMVHWEPTNNRFFCPCHNGAFDKKGKAVSGPPAAASQSLKQYPVKVEEGLVFVKVPTHNVTAESGAPGGVG